LEASRTEKGKLALLLAEIQEKGVKSSRERKLKQELGRASRGKKGPSYLIDGGKGWGKGREEFLREIRLYVYGKGGGTGLS